MNLNIQNCKQFSQNVVPNTFIGGIAKQGGTGVNTPIGTAWKLSKKLGIAVNRITGFRVIGNDIECRIKGNYNLNQTATHFGGSSIANANQNITYWYDDDNLIQSVNHYFMTHCQEFFDFRFNGILNIGSYSTGGFHGAISYNNVEHIYLPNCVLIGNVSTFMNNVNLKNVIMTKLVTVGGNGNLRDCPLLEVVDWRKVKMLGHELNRIPQVFLNSGSSSTILKVHQDIQNVAVDGGGLDVNVAYAKNVRGWTIELYDDNGNYVSTL